MSRLSRELLFVLLQFLEEENYKEAARRLESESGIYCNVNYIEELVNKGDWDELDKYLGSFIHVGDNRYSLKMLFEIRKQKYLEALEKNEHVKALHILNQELKVFKLYNEELFKEMTHLLTVENIRENEHLSTYTDDKTARGLLVTELKKLIESNPELRDKCQRPTVKNSRLRYLINQSLNWQHQLCQNPKSDPDITSLLVDHTCGPPNVFHGQPLMAHQFGSTQRPGGFQLQMFTPQATGVFLATSRGQRTVYPSSSTHHPNSGGGLVLAAPNNGGESELVLRRSRPVGVSDDQIRSLLTSSVPRPGQSLAHNFFSSDDLPKNVISIINESSEVKSMDFHPVYQNLLLVGTNNGDISIWEIGSRIQLAHKPLKIWNIEVCSFALQALTNEHHAFVNRVMWSPDGRFLGVAYSKHIVHVYSYCVGQPSQPLREHLQIEAHAGNVSDLAFFIRDDKLYIITCGEDKTVKVWDVLTGANECTLEGHDAPVYSVCPNRRENIQACDNFLYSTDVEGKMKVWVYGDARESRIDYETPGYTCTRMAFSTDGLRLFSCGSSNEQEPYLIEWNETEGIVKQQYVGLGMPNMGILQFDTTNKYLAVADEFVIKFWNMDNPQLLFSTHADGGLLAFPCIRFSKDGMLLAVSTSDNGVKILGNAEGHRLVRKNQSEAHRVASGTFAKPSTIIAFSSAAGSSIGLSDRSIPITAMAPQNQDSQNLPDVRNKNTDVLEFSIVWRPKDINEPSQLRSLKLPDNLISVRIVRLVYANSGSAVLALAYSAIHKLWKWQQAEKNTSGNATADVEPQLWQPSSGILMLNDIVDANMDETVPCLAISRNSSYVLSASGGKVSLFNLTNFKTMAAFLKPPPAATCVVFNPKDNNIIAVGLSDSSILIYNVRMSKVLQRLNGHQKCVTGIAFFIDKKILVSSGADAQLCVWNTENWEKLTSNFLSIPSRRSNNSQSETRVHHNIDQSRLLVVHETHIATYDPLKLDCILQWVPRQATGSITDAVYSCDGSSIFVSAEDGSVCVLTANKLRVKCRISFSAYVSSNCSTIRVWPNAIAAHPTDPNQIALGLSDGGVYVLEPLESDKQWGSDPFGETAAGPSTNHDAKPAEP